MLCAIRQRKQNPLTSGQREFRWCHLRDDLGRVFENVVQEPGVYLESGEVHAIDIEGGKRTPSRKPGGVVWHVVVPLEDARPRNHLFSHVLELVRETE